MSGMRTYAWIGFLISGAASVFAQDAAGAWKDPSPHAVQLIQVGDDVRLEVLDWGGSGRPLVLLAGGGNTAHVFDDFATKLTAHHHVYGITRRGFGSSGYVETPNPGEHLGKDVLTVLDALKLSRPILVGHSIGGAELSWMANVNPERIAGVVYLDAGYSYAFDDGKGTPVSAMMAVKAPDPPAPSAADLISFGALQDYYLRVEGIRIPEAELRAQRQAKPDGSVGDYRNLPGGSMLMKLIDSGQKFTKVPVPALFLFANPHRLGPFTDSDASSKRQAKEFDEALTKLTEKQVKAVSEGLPSARVITIPGASHYVFLSNEGDVLRYMDAFLADVK